MTRCRSSPASGSRSRATRSPSSRPTATGWRCASSPGTPRPPTPATWPWSPPARCPTPPRRSAPPASVESRSASSAGGDGLIGFEAGRRRTTTRLLDGDYPKVTSLFPDQRRHRRRDRDRRPRRGGQARRPRRRAQHPGPAEVHRGPGRDRGRHRATTPRPARRSRPRSPATTSRSPSTRSSCWTASARWHAVRPAVVHPDQPARGALRAGRGGRRGRHVIPLRPDAGALRPADARRSSPAPRTLRRRTLRCTSD